MEALQLFKDFVDELSLENSTNYKAEVLAKYKDNEDIRFMLRYLYNPYVVNGISRLKTSKFFADLPDVELNSKQVLKDLADRRTGDDAALRLMKGFAKQLNRELREVFYRLVIKDYPLGIGVLTINKVMPNLIPTFNIMLAAKYEDLQDRIGDQNFTLTRKIDGSRIVMLKEEGQVKFFSRAGQLYEGLHELESAARHLPDDIMLDGELTLLDPKDLDSKAQYKETMKISRRNGIKIGLKMLVFDTMPIKHFYLERCDLPYHERRKHLAELTAKHATPFFEVLPVLYQGNDKDMIAKVLEEQIANGEEGIMLNVDNGAYEFKRSGNLLKVKKMHDIDLLVVGLEEGLNSNAGKLGAFVVEYKGNQVRVGSGIDKETREEVWANKDEYIGTVIKVQYFEETSNAEGKLSLRFPVFLGFRTDKVED